MLINYKTDPSLYANFYSKLNITGTQFLAFRDIQMLIDNYVVGKTTLDYGSGAGASTMYLKSIGLEVQGVDINHEMIRLARIKDPYGTYNLITSGKIEAQDKSFDLVFASWVLMEISFKEELFRVIKEISRVLKEGGTFIAIVCNKNTYNADWLSENTEFQENLNLRSGSIVKMFFKEIDLCIYDYFWTEEDYLKAIDMADLKLIKIHYPIGKSDEGYNWVTEKIKSPCSIFIAQK